MSTCYAPTTVEGKPGKVATPVGISLVKSTLSMRSKLGTLLDSMDT